MRRAFKIGMITLKIVAPFVTVVLAVMGAQWLIATKPPPPQQEEAEILPAVHIARAQKGPIRFPSPGGLCLGAGGEQSRPDGALRALGDGRPGGRPSRPG